MKVIWFLDSTTLHIFQNGPLLGALTFLLTKTVHHKQTPEKWNVWLSFRMWEKDECEKGKKEMPRKNQQDMRCFEANDFLDKGYLVIRK